MIRYCFVGLTQLFALLNPALSGGKSEVASDRGAMAYENHCVECHTEQVHWRKKRLASDKKSLFAEVKRWQHALNLDWNKADIE